MSCKISRRSFLKVSGCLMLGSAVSGLLCGAGAPAEGGAAVPTVGGLRVNYIRAFAKDYGNNFRQMEIHLNIENTNSSAAYFNVKAVCGFGKIHVRDVVIVILHVLLDELAHCVFQVGIKQLVAAGFGHIGLRFPEKRFKSYHYFRDFLDVSGIRNDYLALFVSGGLFYEISERIVHSSDLLCDKLREGRHIRVTRSSRSVLFQFTPLREGRRQKICNFCKSFVQPLQISMA